MVDKGGGAESSEVLEKEVGEVRRKRGTWS